MNFLILILSIWQPWRPDNSLYQCSHQLNLHHLHGPIHGLHLHHQEIVLLLLWQILRGMQWFYSPWHSLSCSSVIVHHARRAVAVDLIRQTSPRRELTLTVRHGRWHLGWEPRVKISKCGINLIVKTHSGEMVSRSAKNINTSPIWSNQRENINQCAVSELENGYTIFHQNITEPLILRVCLNHTSPKWLLFPSHPLQSPRCKSGPRGKILPVVLFIFNFLPHKISL